MLPTDVTAMVLSASTPIRRDAYEKSAFSPARAILCFKLTALTLKTFCIVQSENNELR